MMCIQWDLSMDTFSSVGIKMFSADSTGTIIMWTTNVNRQQTTDVDQWNILKEISSPDLKVLVDVL
jgi:hypothetical protein